MAILEIMSQEMARDAHRIPSQSGPRKVGSLSLLLTCLLLTACGTKPAPPLESPGLLRVFVMISPQRYLVERIGGDLVSVGVLVQQGLCAESYEITPRQMDELARAQLFFRIGMPSEESILPKLAEVCPKLKVVDLREGVPLLSMAAHQDEGHEEHAGPDPHIWLDPVRARTEAQTIAKALSGAAPEHREDFEAGLRAVESDLDALHARISAELAPCRGRKFYVFHPSYGYFAERYGLRQESIEQDGKGPGARYVDELITRMKSEGVKALFVPPQLNNPSAKAIAESVGAAMVELDPFAPDYIGNLESIARALAKGLG